MKPAVFDYYRPSTVTDAVQSLHELGSDAKVLAGGQSLIPLMNFRLSSPERLIDVNGLPELHDWSRRGDVLRLGATTRHQELGSRTDIAEACPLLAQAARFIGHPQIRVRGTLGGSLAHADPSAELPAAAVALDATIIARSIRGERRIPAGEFFTFHLSTALDDDELVVAVEFPVAAERQGSSFLEVAARFGDFAAVGATAVLAVDETGRISHARVVCSSVGPTPARIQDAEPLLAGTRLEPEVLAELEALVRRSVDPSPELKVTAAYKRRTAGVLARRAAEEAMTMAQGRAA